MTTRIWGDPLVTQTLSYGVENRLITSSGPITATFLYARARRGCRPLSADRAPIFRATGSSSRTANLGHSAQQKRQTQ